MNEEKAREVLKDAIKPNGDLYSLGWYLSWKAGDIDGTLDGTFTIEDLEAIVWWARRGADQPSGQLADNQP